MVGGYFLLLAFTMQMVPASLLEVWRAWGVPALEPHFGDLAGLVAGIENQDAGRGVGERNPFDPWHRPYNNPTLWFAMKYIGLNRQTETLFGFGIVALFYASVVHVLGRLTRPQGIYAGLFLLSPAVMTGIERCNVDLMIFSLLGAVLLLRGKPFFVAPMLAPAALLKIYPIGALLALCSPPWRRTLPWLVAALVLIFFYELANFRELEAVAASAPHYAYFTFGSTTFAIWLAQAGGAGATFNYPRALFWSDTLFVIASILAMMKSPRLAPEPKWERELFAFRLGAGIYLASFGLGANSDYRMIFFLFCLPFLFLLQNKNNPARWWAGTALICGLMHAAWFLLSDEYLMRHVLIRELMSWGTAISLAGLVGTTLAWPAGWTQAREAHPSSP
jgi:hypothetical protein